MSNQDGMPPYNNRVLVYLTLDRTCLYRSAFARPCNMVVSDPQSVTHCKGIPEDCQCNSKSHVNKMISTSIPLNTAKKQVSNDMTITVARDHP
jgi:hypothetical protein